MRTTPTEIQILRPSLSGRSDRLVPVSLEARSVDLPPPVANERVYCSSLVVGVLEGVGLIEIVGEECNVLVLGGRSCIKEELRASPIVVNGRLSL